jgi:hypothetical protein
MSTHARPEMICMGSVRPAKPAGVGVPSGSVDLRGVAKLMAVRIKPPTTKKKIAFLVKRDKTK